MKRVLHEVNEVEFCQIDLMDRLAVSAPDQLDVIRLKVTNLQPLLTTKECLAYILRSLSIIAFSSSEM